MDQKKGTHVSTKPNAAKTMPLDGIKISLASKSYMNQIENYFHGNRKEAIEFATSSVEYIRKVPKLLECNELSVLSALMTSAQFRFMPSGVGGEAYIIPYGKEANFQIGYQGWLTLIWRTGKVRSVKAVIVHENDKFKYEEGLDTTLEHTPAKFGEERGEPIGVYAVAEMKDGGRVFTVMSKGDIMAIRELSKAKNKPESPWSGKRDPQLWMWKKTCLIQLCKLLPKSREVQEAIAIDHKGEGIKKEELDVEGPAALPAPHAPEERDPEKCKAGKHHSDYEDEKGNCSECAKDKKSV